MRTSLASLFFSSIFVVMSFGCQAEEELLEALPSAREAPAEALFSPGDLRLEGAWALSERLDAPDGGTRIGMLIDLTQLGAAPDVEVRGFDAWGRSGPWQRAEVTFYEHPYVVARADVGVPIYGAQMRVPASQAAGLAFVTLSAVVPELVEIGKADMFGTQQGALSGGDVQPRSAWKAKSSKCTSVNPNKYRIAIHHTVTPPTAYGTYEARLRSIQAYHMDTRGWCDVGYHYLVTEDGRVWEGRPEKHRGAHVGGHNTGNVGIAFVGCFDGPSCKSIGEMAVNHQMLDGAAGLIAALSQTHGIAVDADRVKGHKDHKGAWTSCPGAHLHAKLDDLRALANGTQVVTPEQPPAEEPAENCEPHCDVEPPTGQKTGAIMGVVWDGTTADQPNALSALRLTDAVVSIDGGVPQLVSSSSAYWEVKVPEGVHTLRAEAPGYEPVELAVKVYAGGETWSSVALYPKQTAATTTVKVTVTEGMFGQGIAHAIVHAPGVGAFVTDTWGQATFELPGGTHALTTYAATMGAVTVQVNRRRAEDPGSARLPLRLGRRGPASGRGVGPQHHEQSVGQGKPPHRRRDRAVQLRRGDHGARRRRVLGTRGAAGSAHVHRGGPGLPGHDRESDGQRIQKRPVEQPGNAPEVS